jgi:hypothetical protein
LILSPRLIILFLVVVIELAGRNPGQQFVN